MTDLFSDSTFLRITREKFYEETLERFNRKEDEVAAHRGLRDRLENAQRDGDDDLLIGGTPTSIPGHDRHPQGVVGDDDPDGLGDDLELLPVLPGGRIPC